eukprot:jgi/Ulvmu1/5966/UM026_0089.1
MMMGSGAADEPGKPSLEPLRRKPVIANAATGMLGAYVVRARQESDVQFQDEGSHASGRGLKLKLTKKTKGGARKNARGRQPNHKASDTRDGSGLTETEQLQLAMQSQIAEEKARRYEAIERGEIAASDDYNVDFSKRAPPEPAQRQTPTRPSSPEPDYHPRSPGRGRDDRPYHRHDSRSPSPHRGHSKDRAPHARQHATPAYDATGPQLQQRASPTYEAYRARSRERESPSHGAGGGYARRRAGLGYGAHASERDGLDDASPNKEKDHAKQRHYQEFLKRQEQWERADDEKQRQREMLKEALPAEQERIKRVMAQAQKQRLEGAAMEERLVELMMAKEKAERKAKKKAAKRK